MPTKTARKRDLSRDRILQAALRIADDEGLEALSMRRLGAELGVEAASLYHHIPGKDALLDGVVVLVRSEIRIPEPPPSDWRDLMEAIFTEYGRVLARHPNLVTLAGRRVETDPDSGLVFLTQLGLTTDDAVELWQSVIAFTVGYALFASTAATSDTWDLPDALAARMQQWKPDTATNTLRLIIDAFDARRQSPASFEQD